MGKAEQTKTYVTRIAAFLFNKKGYFGTSVDEIVVAARLTRGSLYGHFENKEDLYNSASEYLLEEWLKGLRTVLAGATSAGHKMEAFFQWYETEAVAAAYGGSPVINLATEADDLSPAVSSKTGTSIARLMRLLSETLTDGIANGELSDQLDPLEFACLTLSALEGAAALTRVTGKLHNLRSVCNFLREELHRLENFDRSARSK